MSNSFMEELSFESDSKQAEHLHKQARKQLSALGTLMRACAASSHPTVGGVRGEAEGWRNPPLLCRNA